MQDPTRHRAVRLTQDERQAYKRYLALAPAHDFWKAVVSLKADLLVLGGAAADSVMGAEAETLAEAVVTRLYELARQYRIVGSPFIHNLAIKARLRRRGYCYHYVSDLLKTLNRRHWRHFQLHWAGSHKGTARESNALAITYASAPFASGMVVDAWRTGGKPYWRPIAGDTYSWVEDTSYYITP